MAEIVEQYTYIPGEDASKVLTLRDFNPVYGMQFHLIEGQTGKLSLACPTETNQFAFGVSTKKGKTVKEKQQFDVPVTFSAGMVKIPQSSVLSDHRRIVMHSK